MTPYHTSRLNLYWYLNKTVYQLYTAPELSHYSWLPLNSKRVLNLFRYINSYIYFARTPTSTGVSFAGLSADSERIGAESAVTDISWSPFPFCNVVGFFKGSDQNSSAPGAFSPAEDLAAEDRSGGAEEQTEAAEFFDGQHGAATGRLLPLMLAEDNKKIKNISLSLSSAASALLLMLARRCWMRRLRPAPSRSSLANSNRRRMPTHRRCTAWGARVL